MTPARGSAEANDIVVLEKEMQLGKELLDRAANGITAESLKEASQTTDEKEQNAVRTFIAILSLASEGSYDIDTTSE